MDTPPRKPNPTDASDEEREFAAPYLMLMTADAPSSPSSGQAHNRPEALGC